MSLLFSGFTGLMLFSFGLVWLLLNACAICACMWIKLKLARGLEKCLAKVNKQLIKHKLLVTLDDRGKMSCHKVNLCFLFFESEPCVTQLQQVIDREEGGAIAPGWERRLDVPSIDIIIQGNQSTRLSRRQVRKYRFSSKQFQLITPPWRRSGVGGDGLPPLLAALG
jgi:hypothetical protein